MLTKTKFHQIVAILLAFTMLFSAIQPTSASAQGGDGLKRQVNAQSGKVSFIGPKSGRVLPAALALGTFLRPQEPALALAQRYAPEFGIQNPARELREIKRRNSENGRLTVRYQQKYEGIPVMGGELIVNTNENGDLYSMSGEVSPGLTLQTQPRIDSAQAAQTALQALAKWYEKTPADFNVSEPELWIFDESLLRPSTRPAELVWRMEVTPKELGMPLRELVLVNAERGNISLHFNEVDTSWTGVKPSNPDQPLAARPLPSSNSEISANPVTAPITTENMPALAPVNWYVATTGNDSNSCTSTALPCLTINGALGKANSGDTIYVASGVYTNTTTSVVTINKNITLSGGWNTIFTMQNGLSTIDGQGALRGVMVNQGITALIERIVVQNGNASQGGGIYNESGSILTINSSSIINNKSDWGGGGIFNNPGGILTLNNSIISHNKEGIRNYGILELNTSTITGNTALGPGSPAGIYNDSVASLSLNNSAVSDNMGRGIETYGTITLNSTIVSNNTNSGIYNADGTLTMNNSTVSRNTGTHYGSVGIVGGGIINHATAVLNNSTVSDNTAASGGGIYNFATGTITLKNTIIAGNSSMTSGPNCYGSITSAGYNVIGNTSGCTFTISTGDKTNIDPKLGELIGSPGYYSLQAGSPAINAGNPAIPGSGSNACLINDVRGLTRPVGTQCDIGAYEYAVPGSLSSLSIMSGNNQHASLGLAFPMPLKVAALDNQGSPVANVSVTFSAPGSGASGTFADTGTHATTVVTNEGGVATTSIFTANTLPGSYTVVASASGAESVALNLLNGIWYVATTGNDNNDCQTPATPCATINTVLDKTGFAVGDTVLVASGTYTGVGSQAVLLNKDVDLSGGWNATFTIQNEWSTIDGQNTRPGMGVNSGVSATVERFVIQNGSSSYSGGGIYNGGTLVLNNSLIQNNTCCSNGEYGAGISNWGTLTVNNSTITGNYTPYYGGGGGLYNRPGQLLVLNNSTVSGNTAFDGGGFYGTGTVILNNSTVSGNSATNYGGGLFFFHDNYYGGTFTSQNSLIAGNSAVVGGPDCHGSAISSAGYNLIGNNSGCTFTPTTGDLVGTSASPINPQFAPTLSTSWGYYPLLPNSPAINAGNTATCLSTDQRGVPRPQGIACDTGAFEYQGGVTPAYIVAYAGTPQSIVKGSASSSPLKAVVLDADGDTVPGVTVTFTAPASGASVIFTSTGMNVSPVNTDANGIATSSTLLANNISGGYTIQATVGAVTGSVGFQIANIGSVQVRTYTSNNTTSLPGTLLCNETAPTCTSGNNLHADAAHKYAIGTYDLYASKHLRNSLDNAGMTIISTVHYDVNYSNAFWDGTQAVFGDGAGWPLADDVVAHELTHGVTERESNLFYFYQSGAINESFSDLWGEYYDQTNGQGTDTAQVKWLAAEDIATGGTGAMRSMSNPPAYGDPDRMTSGYYYNGDGDNGGVHTNSGINNKAVYLMVDGGSFNGKTVAALGWDKAAAIYYEANTNLLTTGSNYSDLYYALQEACKDLTGQYGITSGNCDQVKNALDAVEMSSPAYGGFYPAAPACGPGMAPTPLFKEEFESGTGNWDILGSGQWSWENWYATSGTHMMWGDDYYGSSDSQLSMKTGVYLPPGPSYYLHFRHAFLFEYEYSTYYDGGVLEYSLNNGATWSDAAPLFWAGKNYNGTLYYSPGSSNTLKGRTAFVGDSHGYISSQYNLSSLVGQTLKFRWRFATDQFYGFMGWTLDDVQIYKCDPDPHISGDASAPGVALSYTDGTPKVVYADWRGKYSLAVSNGWSGIVTPSLPGFTFDPPNRSYTNVTSNQIDQDYTALVAISGNAGVAGVTLSYIDGMPKTVISDGSGNYSISVTYGWSGTVTPSRTGFTFVPTSQTYTNLTANQSGQNYLASWVGGITIQSDQNVVAVGRPHIGSEVASYGGFSAGSLTAYVPMLFKTAFGSYDSALYVQNVHTSSTANIIIKYYDSNGVLNCTKADTIAPRASKGYWVPSVTCDTGSLPMGWVGGVVVTSDQPIVAVGRPHVGSEVMTYAGFASGSLSAYVPMLFKGAFGGSYDSAFYLQNTHASNTASLTIKYYDSSGVLNCTKTDTIAPLASKGYWVPSATCDSGSLSAGWVGGVVVTSDQPIVAVGRPHIGTQVTTYTGFASGSLSAYVPMLFKGAFGGSYDSAFYLQNTHASNTASITLQYYDNAGTLNCTKTDTIAPLASQGYWVPSASCDTGSLPSGWVGGVVVTSDQPIVAVGRPHIGTQVTTYNGFTSGHLNAYLPMLFNGAFGGSYNSAFYIQNTESSAAAVTIKFYDSSGALSCTRSESIPALSTLGYWVPSVTCDP